MGAGEKKGEDVRQEYQRPMLRVIELAAEEVMATGCKTVGSTSTGVNGFPCASNQCVSKDTS